MFGGAIAKGLQQAGQGATTAGKFYGQVVADNGFNQFQDAANKILHGDPNATTIGPDGAPQQDLGYLGLKGEAALKARPGVEKRLDQLQKDIMENMSTPEMQLQFDNYSRRYRTSISAQIGSHADTQANAWYGEVNNASAALAKQHIAVNAGDDDMFNHGLEDLKHTYVKQAQLAGGGPELIQKALEQATREAYATRIETIGATNPTAALQMADANKAQLGAAYPEIHQRLESRSKEQKGNGAGDVYWKQAGAQVNDSVKFNYDAKTGRFDIPDREAVMPAPGGKVPPPVYDAAGNPLPQEGGGASYKARVAQIENPSGNPNATSSTGATGKYQFEPGTWATFGHGGNIHGDQEGAMDELTAHNQASLTKSLGRPPTPGELYIAHQQGDAGAAKLLLNPNARAGDLVGDKAIRVNGGDPNAPASAFTNKWIARFNGVQLPGGFTTGGPAAVANAPRMVMPAEAGGTPEAPAPPADTPAATVSLADQRAKAMTSVMDDPNLDFDERRHALAYIEQQYSARNTGDSVERQTLESTIPNLILARENGVENVNIPWERAAAVLPPAKFNRYKDEWDIAEQTGTAIKALRWSSPEDVAAMQKDIESGQGVLSEAMKAHHREPTTGPGVVGANPEATEDEAMRQKLRIGMARQFEAAYARRQAMLVGPDADPAQYVFDHPIVAAARARLDPSQPATFGAYAAATLAIQQHVGAANPQIFDKGMAERLAARWADPAKLGGGTAVAADIRAEAQKWGDYWPQIYNQVAPKTSAMIRVIGAGVQNGADRQLLEAQGVKDDELLKGHDDPEAKRKDINYAVADNLKTIARTFPGAQRSQTLADLQGTAERLTLIRAAGAPDQDVATIAKNAVDDIVNFKYDFQNSYRIPKNPNYPPSVIQAGVVEATRQLGNPEALNVPGGSPEAGPLSILSKADQQQRGLPEDYLSSETAEGLRNNGVWMTDPQERGLVLMQPNQMAARRPDGSPLMLTWGQLKTLSQNRGAPGRASQAEANQSGPGPLATMGQPLLDASEGAAGRPAPSPSAADVDSYFAGLNERLAARGVTRESSNVEDRRAEPAAPQDIQAEWEQFQKHLDHLKNLYGDDYGPKDLFRDVNQRMGNFESRRDPYFNADLGMSRGADAPWLKK